MSVDPWPSIPLSKVYPHTNTIVLSPVLRSFTLYAPEDAAALDEERSVIGVLLGA
jgi:hypothetical protein